MQCKNNDLGLIGTIDDDDDAAVFESKPVESDDEVNNVKIIF